MSGLDPLLTAEQAQAILGVSRWWLDKHADQVGAIKVGKFLRFTAAGLQQYIEAQTVKPPTPEPAPVAPTRRLSVVSTSTLDPATLRPRKPYSGPLKGEASR
jgi:hypothetical protein